MTKILFFISGSDELGLEIALEHNNENDEVAICLLQNAVYLATKTNKLTEKCLQNNKVYVVKEDIEKRGIEKMLLNDIKQINYGEVIDLVVGFENIINI